MVQQNDGSKPVDTPPTDLSPEEKIALVDAVIEGKEVLGFFTLSCSPGPDGELTADNDANMRVMDAVIAVVMRM